MTEEIVTLGQTKDFNKINYTPRIKPVVVSPPFTQNKISQEFLLS
jgi:hypothetical protein